MSTAGLAYGEFTKRLQETDSPIAWPFADMRPLEKVRNLNGPAPITLCTVGGVALSELRVDDVAQGYRGPATVTFIQPQPELTPIEHRLPTIETSVPQSDVGSWRRMIAVSMVVRGILSHDVSYGRGQRYLDLVDTDKVETVLGIEQPLGLIGVSGTAPGFVQGLVTDVLISERDPSQYYLADVEILPGRTIRMLCRRGALRSFPDGISRPENGLPAPGDVIRARRGNDGETVVYGRDTYSFRAGKIHLLGGQQDVS